MTSHVTASDSEHPGVVMMTYFTLPPLTVLLLSGKVETTSAASPRESLKWLIISLNQEPPLNDDVTENFNPQVALLMAPGRWIIKSMIKA